MHHKDENSVSSDINDFEGKRLPHFTYTNKEMLSTSKWDEKVKEEVVRVKDSINPKVSGWIKSKHPDGDVYLEDPVSEMNKVGAKTRNELVLVGITKVKDLYFSSLSPTETNSKLASISKKYDISLSCLR